MHPILSSLPALALLFTPWQEGASDPGTSGSEGRRPSIEADELEAHVRALTSPGMEGRAVGSDGSRRAADYLARELDSLGLSPGGDEGTFFQDIPLVKYSYPEHPKLTLRAKSGKSVEGIYGVDFDLQLRGSGQSTAELPIKLVQQARQMPKALDRGLAINVNGSKPQREEWIANSGLPNFDGWGLEVVTSLDQSTWRLGKEGPPPQARLERPLVGEDPCEIVTLRATLRQFYLGAAPNTVTAQLEIKEEIESVIERNVVGRLEGTGASDEVLVLSAYYDGPGETGPRRESKMRPAADENASGCAALLEIAEAMAAGPAPARTVLFVFRTGEEWKKIGRERFLAGPPAPFEKTALHLSVNKIGRPDPELESGKLWMTGYGRTDFGELSGAVGLGVTPDKRRRQHYYNRYFDRTLGVLGVPAHTVSSYGGHNDVRRITDTADTLDYGHMETATRRIAQLVEPVALGLVTVSWREGKQPRALEELVSGSTDKDD